MAVRKKGKLESGGESGESQGLFYSAQQIWLAGLGALSRAQAGAPKIFDELLREGSKLQGGALDAAQNAVRQAFRGAQQTVGERVETARERAGESWDNLEKIFESRVQRAISALGVPTASEIAALRRRVDELAARVDRLSRTGAAKRSSPSARRRSKSS
jgi:poly(hydroxyalkanoate) granule-associated protein